MLASLPKLADKNFVIGFLLPVLIAGLAGVFLFRDTPAGLAVWKLVVADKTLSDLTVAVVGAWTLALGLVLVNYHAYRLLEGYVWPLKQRRWIRSQQVKYDALTGYLTKLYPQIFPRPGTACEKVQQEYFRRRQEYNTRYPFRRELLLSTRFGNVIRSFESYPAKVYGVDSIPVWPRLQAVVPADVTVTIGDARAQVDFFINVLVLAALIGVAAFVRFVTDLYRVHYCAGGGTGAFTTCGPLGWGDVRIHWEWLVWLVATFGVARICYEFAIDRAVVWGVYVKAAFDLYLPALARQLGYVLPATDGERREFWDAMNSQLLYAAPVDDRWPRLPADPPGQTTGQTPDDSG